MRHLRRFTLYLVVSFAAFYFGTWVNFHVHELPSRSSIGDCFCTGVKCRVLTVADHPGLVVSHPSETFRMIKTARWKDGW